MAFQWKLACILKKEDKKRLLDEQRLKLEVIQIQKNAGLMDGVSADAPLEPDAQSQTVPSWSAEEMAAAYGEPVKPTSHVENTKSSPEVKKSFEKKESFSKKSAYKKSDNPDVLYGRDFDEEPTPIEQIQTEMGELVIRGKIIALDTREIRGEKTILIFDVTDFTDTITVKMFARNEQLPDIMPHVKPGAFVKLKGVTTIDRFDGELTVGSVVGIRKCSDFTVKRMDTAVEKRVELHCHTKMSDMDGVADVKDIIKRAMEWGHTAIAITDHGNVAAFPVANHETDGKFKILYGCEGYLVDDLKDIVEHSENQSLAGTYVVFDIETTGFSPMNNQIIEIGAVKVSEGQITDRFSEFINPREPIPFEIEKLTGINDEMVIHSPGIEEVLPRFLAFSEGAVMVAHNASFDMSFLYANARRLNIPLKKTVVDTVGLARVLLPELNKYKLDVVAKALHISLENHHRAVDDAEATAGIFQAFIQKLRERDIDTLDKVNELSAMSADALKKLPSHHVIGKE